MFLFAAATLFACNSSETIEDPDPEFPYSVLEYMPAPGQFINDTREAGFDGSQTTPAAAIEYAQGRLENGWYVSLGGFGGYIVVGFDDSIANNGADAGGDFTIEGNQHAGSSEPGVVWVMQDANGNGRPDDVWYELRGSETDKPETIQNYWVEYSRPANGEDVPWTDSEGNEGVILRNSFHTQPNYYPAWVAEHSYRLYGTRLEARNYLDEDRNEWVNPPYDRGYADNLGDDCLTGANARKVRFKISNAMKSDGTPATLQYIDFIKVQSAVNDRSGHLGELSTEVLSFEDI